MKIKKYYIAIQTGHGGKYDCCILPVTECDNIYAKLKGIRELVTANIYDTQKAATAVVLAWRDGFRASGVYRWDYMEDGSEAPF